MPLKTRLRTFLSVFLPVRFASAAAGFGMLLRDSPYKGNAGYDTIFNLALTAYGKDELEYRWGFLVMIKKAQTTGN